MSNKSILMIMIVLMTLFVVTMPVSAKAVGTIVNQGATVFIGEQGLDVSKATAGYDIGWWAPGASFESSPRTITMGSRASYMSITQSDFGGYTGTWYRLYPNTTRVIAFRVEDPQLDLEVRNSITGDSVNGKTVARGTGLTFRINSNMYQIASTNREGLGVYIPITIVSSPRANFSVSGTSTVNFVDTSNNTPTNWTWDFGDEAYSTQANSTQANPFYAYKTSNIYTVIHTASNAQGTSTVTGIINVSSLAVKVDSFSYSVYSPNSVSSGGTTGAGTKLSTVSNGYSPTYGFIDIKVKTDSGATLSSLYDFNGAPNYLTDQFINTQPYTWNGVWATNNTAYPAGKYTVWAESNLNGMKENYRSGGADYTSKTVSPVYTITFASSTLKIEINKQAVVRGNPFSVTLTGQPSTSYYMGLKNIGSLESTDTAPHIENNQEGVNINGTNSYHAIVTTDSSGQRTVGFTTNSNTKEQKYTIRAETMAGTYKYDEIVINVAKGAMTLAAQGDQTFYLGEEVKFYGTNSETNTVYLFITGPNLNSNGARIEEPGLSVINGDESTFRMIDVEGDDTFKFDWSTSKVDLDAGTYTVYAVSLPHDRSGLSNASYATTSITIKKPYVSAKIRQNIIAKGDKITIEGIASGQPANVQIWILGKNFVKIATQSVDNDDTYKYEIPEGETTNMASGQYFLIVHHPMQNSRLDIIAVEDNTYVKNLELGTTDSGSYIFKLQGGGSLQGSDAAEALVQAINDPNIDDTYTKLNFMLTESIIAIDPIPDKSIGDKFTLVGRTNLAIDDEVMIEIYSSSFGPTVKTKSGEFSGTTATVKVKEGTKDDGFNMFTLDVDASSFKADEYLVLARGVVQEATGTALFNVKEVVILPPTAVVTAEPALTPIAPITVPPTVPTVMPTTVVPTTTKSPGFGAIYALVGLIGIGFVIVRREE